MQFYCPNALADGKQHIRTRDKTLVFSSTVLFTIIVKKLNSLKHLVRTTVAEYTTKTTNMKKAYYLVAHRRLVNVLTSNSAFFIFAVLVV